MLSFPSITKTHQVIPKEVFYKQLNLNSIIKNSFISDIKSIIVTNSLTMDSLKLNKKSNVDNILVIEVNLKKSNINLKTLEAISKQNPHKILYILRFEDQSRLAIYYKKIYLSKWDDTTQIDLELKGQTLKEIWQSFLKQIIIETRISNLYPDCNLEELISIQNKINKLEKLVRRTEKQMWNEKQPKKKLELRDKFLKFKNELEKLKKSEN